MHIYIINRQKTLKIPAHPLKKIIRFLLEDVLEASCSQVDIHLVSTRTISRLHKIYFNDPTPTDCISFPMDDIILGTVFVCPEVAKNYALARNMCPYRETVLYIIHGLLHLLGYDDMSQKERTRMRKKERLCLKKLDENTWIQRLHP